MSKHLLKFSQLKSDEKTDAGYRIKANQNNFPVLKGMSLYLLVLEPLGIREPHWHANADELGYCLRGKVLVSLYHTDNVKSTFLVNEGECFLVPSGALHAIENVGDTQAKLLLNFSNENTEDFSLSGTLGMFSNAVLGNTWHTPATVFSTFKRSLIPTFATLSSQIPSFDNSSNYSSIFHFNLENTEAIVTNTGGYVKVARQNVWPILKRQALYSLHLTGEGMREPHWHPETAELGYVNKGKGRMSILSPSGDVDTYMMEEGDIYFIPKAYPHHIENLNNEELHLLIFFDQSMPEDIGLTGSVKSFSDEVLASTLKSTPEFFAKLPKYYQDLFIVQKINPID